MISVGFNRVSKRRPCRICGKPTYCGFSRDEGTSICMRISAGSRGLFRNVETYTFISRFHSSRFDQESRGPSASQFRWLLLKSETLFFREFNRNCAPISNPCASSHIASMARTQSGEIVYVYDELGRLIAVIDLAGETAVCSYGAVVQL
jgi:YD repeat-containing protein